jgi:hypothetical protein
VRSGVFARVCWASQNTNQSGRTVQVGFLEPNLALLRPACGRLDLLDQTATTRFLDKPILTGYLVVVRIGQTARKHGIADEDMLHAVRNPIMQWRLDDEFTMRVGPARDGDLLEIGVLGIDTDDPVIVHAMRARPQYLPHQ